jgi:hypothetical protein
VIEDRKTRIPVLIILMSPDNSHERVRIRKKAEQSSRRNSQQGLKIIWFLFLAFLNSVTTSSHREFSKQKGSSLGTHG